MKKCPECGNPSYDGAPICGNCGYKFPKPKIENDRTEPNIFKDTRRHTDDKSTFEIIKENKIVIGIILAVTIIAICGIVLSGPHNQNSTSDNNVKFSEYGFSFTFPSSWNETAGKDSSHKTAIFFDAGNNTIVEFYNVTSDYTSLKEINKDRISKALSDGDSVSTILTTTIDGRNASDLILENSNGDYTRYVSLFGDGELYVFKITGDSLNNVNSTSINNAIETSHIE